ncbi:uncharacterized protein [Nothobranchius furzeri]|uniref:uncharacterized protein n=1 Tax=Nothobranchius furzeri TaxID=105023 RepID=UPI00390498CC
MVDSCCAPGCQNRRGQVKGRSFYRIPKDPERRKRWIIAMKRASLQCKTKQWDPDSKGFRLCSEHFISGKKSDHPLSPDYIPSIFKHVTSPEKKRRRRQLDGFIRRQKRRLQRREQAKSASATVSPSSKLLIQQDSCEHDIIQPPAADQAEEAPVKEVTQNEVEPTHDSSHPETTVCSNETCKEQIKSLELECQALRNENMLLRQKITCTEINETTLQKSDRKVNMLTGLSSYSQLMVIFNVIMPYLKHKSSLTLFQQYILALIKMRMNLSFDFLAFYFSIDSTTVSKLFKHCVSVMYCTLVPSLVIWPERESLRESIPYAFRNSVFEKTVCIIDCFEIFLEKPSNLSASAQCYSAYKSHHTMKYLIAITPQGSICFISN